MDEITKKIKHTLDNVDNGKVSALAEGNKVLLMIQDAPEELRRLADAMERIGVQEIKAFVAYEKPQLKLEKRELKELAVKPQKEPEDQPPPEESA